MESFWWPPPSSLTKFAFVYKMHGVLKSLQSKIIENISGVFDGEGMGIDSRISITGSRDLSKIND